MPAARSVPLARSLAGRRLAGRVGLALVVGLFALVSILPGVSFGASGFAAAPSAVPASLAGAVRSAGAAIPANSSTSARWTNLTLTSGPPGLMSAAVTDDPADGYVLAFGGLVGGNATNQTWKFQGGVWTNLTAIAGAAPSPRYDMAMAYDPQTGYVLAFGGLTSPAQAERGPLCPPPTGFPGCPLNDTWAFQNGSWARLHPTCDQTNGTNVTSYTCAPLFGGPDLMVYDAHDHYVLMTDYFVSYQSYASGFVVPTWLFENGSWVRDYAPSVLHPSVRMDPAGLGGLAYDAADGVVVGFGSGTNGLSLWPGSGAYQDPVANNTTWTYSNYTWTQVAVNATAPPPSFDPAMSYDSPDGYVLLYGGWNYTCAAHFYNSSACVTESVQTFNDTWAYHDGTWTNLSGGTTPASLGGARLVDDPGDRTVLQSGGWNCSAGTCEYPGGGWFCQTENSSLLPVWNPCPDAGTAGSSTWAWGPSPPLEDVAVTASRTTVTAGTLVNLSVTYRDGGPNVTFRWDFGDGGSATTQNASHAWATAGEYAARVWVNDSANHSGVAALNLTVDGRLGILPAAAPDPTDVGLPVQFSSGRTNGTPPFTFAWSFGDGTSSTLPAPTHAYGSNGTFAANLTVADNSGALTNASFAVVVHPALVVGLNIPPRPADLGQLVNFSANVSGGTLPYTYAWAFGDGGVGGDLANISHIYTTNGPFDPAVTVTDAAGQSVTVAQPLTIALNVSILSNGTLGAAPLGLGFTSHVTGGEPDYAYAWAFGDGSTSAMADPSHTYAAPGTYDATLQVTDAAGVMARSTVWPVVVAPGGGPLDLSLSAAPANVSLGGIETVTAAPQGGVGAYTLTWTNLPPGCSASAILTLRCPAGTSGTYPVAATVTDSHGDVAAAATTFTVSQAGSSGGLTGTGPSSFAGLSLLTREEIAGIAIGGLIAAAVAGFGLGQVARGRSGRAGSPPDPYDRFRRPEPPRPGRSPETPPDTPDTLHDLL